MADLIQLRRDTAANWTSEDPTLAQGEMGIETDTLKLKIGDGITEWTALPYYTTAASGYQVVQEEGTGVTQRATLNFVGGGITAADDGANTRTNVTLDATLNALASYNANGILTQTAADTFAGRAIQGTAGKITVTNGNGVAGNPAITIASTYAGQNTISTLGTITVGVWNGTEIDETKGGTGITSYAKGDILYASATNTLAKLSAGTNGHILKLDAGVPTWAAAGDSMVYPSAGIAVSTGTAWDTPIAANTLVYTTDIGSVVLAYDANLQSFVTTFTLPTTDGAADSILASGGNGVLTLTSKFSRPGTAPDQYPLNQHLGKLAYLDSLGVYITENSAPTVASAASVQLVAPISFISGTAAISTLLVHPDMERGGGYLVVIPTGAWTTTTSGNISKAITAEVGVALLFVYDAVIGKWHPSASGHIDYPLTTEGDIYVAGSAGVPDRLPLGSEGQVLSISSGALSWETPASASTPGSDNFGYLNIPQVSKSEDYTLVLGDSGKHIYHPSTDANARTFTIPANSSVAFPIGTAITFINDSTEDVTIAITSDTLVLAGTGTTGSRTLAQYGMATTIKVESTKWYISGTGLS